MKHSSYLLIIQTYKNQAKNIRIQAPIPGLGVVGIEVPNENRQTVGLRELLESPEFQSKKMEIPMAI